MTSYRETFDDGPGGWFGFISNSLGPKPLEWQPGSVTSRSPWWIDYNHAPPGAGYMHMVFSLSTRGPETESIKDAGGPSRFVAGGFPTNFCDAKLTVRTRGELLIRGANLVLLVQGNVEGIISGWVCTGRPLRVEKEWTEQSILLAPDAEDWTALGTRHDRGDMYGMKPLEKVLSNVDVNIMLILFPLQVSVMGPIDGDPHLLRPERDYPVWRHKLPEGYVTLDEIQIDFP